MEGYPASRHHLHAPSHIETALRFPAPSNLQWRPFVPPSRYQLLRHSVSLRPQRLPGRQSASLAWSGGHLSRFIGAASSGDVNGIAPNEADNVGDKAGGVREKAESAELADILARVHEEMAEATRAKLDGRAAIMRSMGSEGKAAQEPGEQLLLELLQAEEQRRTGAQGGAEAEDEAEAEQGPWEEIATEQGGKEYSSLPVPFSALSTGSLADLPAATAAPAAAGGDGGSDGERDGGGDEGSEDARRSETRQEQGEGEGEGGGAGEQEVPEGSVVREQLGGRPELWRGVHVAGAKWEGAGVGGGDRSGGEGGSGEGAGVGESGGAGSGSYLQARQLLSSMAKSMEQLESGLTARHKEMGESTHFIRGIRTSDPAAGQGAVVRRAEEMVARMQQQFKAMETEAAQKDSVLERLLAHAKSTKKQLRAVEERSRVEKDELRQQMTHQQQRMQQELEGAAGREERMRRQLMEAQEGIAHRDAFLQQLQEEAALSASALKQAARAMVAARDRTLRIEEQLESMGDQLAKERAKTRRERENTARVTAELAEARMVAEEMAGRVGRLEGDLLERDRAVERTQQEADAVRAQLAATQQALEEAARQAEEAEARRQQAEAAVGQERAAAAAALEAQASAEERLREAEGRVQQLALEVTSLKGVVEEKDSLMAAVKDETMRNADMLLAAATTRKELAGAEARILALQGAVAGLEAEVRQQDQLLNDIRADAVSSADALRTAAQINQDLNAAREREAELVEELEQREAEIEGLRRDTTENIRAQRAELALREAERRARELEMERESLRRGVAKRDQALGLMKRELERSAHMLSAAADTRQALRSMKEQMDWMQEEARAKEQRLAALQEEFVSALKGTTFPSLDKSMLKRRKLPPQGKSNEDS
ncbi:hypothetical protein CLOM_g11289 [Closterium sp. NIES-68]|nr:hypothetical protein CLOM_g11289 [Closterium sp. NIES-68]GJP77957.1 hypothetical protein CLOP_g8277 [Closterium sp. NIES-67]